MMSLGEEKSLLSYRPDIDGLRAIAVLAVVFYHAHLGFPGGYVGVDIFFVISGFLITGLLLRDLEAKRFSFSSFWTRRVRRLVPALLVVTVFTALGSSVILLPSALENLGRALIAQPLLLVNVYFWRTMKRGYFGDPPEESPILHTWSLGVEEQFYVVFPLLLYLLHRWFPSRRFVAGILAVLAIASLLLSGLLTPIKSVFSFFMLPTRAWELLLGGLLVFAPAPRHRLSREVLAWGGLALCAVGIFGFTSATPFPGCAALVPCLGAVGLIWAHARDGRSLLHPALSWAPMVRMGAISYSFYLWHWPLMAWGDYLEMMDSTSARWLVVALSLVLGFLSWRLVETPFRAGPSLATPRQAWRGYWVYLVCSSGLGLVFLATQGLSGLWSPAAHSLAASKYDRSHIVECSLEYPPDPLPHLLGDETSSPRFLLWGDSHAMALAPLLDTLSKALDTGGYQLTRTSTAPLLRWGYRAGIEIPNLSPDLQERWVELALALLEEKQLSTVFLVGRWEGYAAEGFADAVVTTYQAFHARGVHVVFVTSVPTQRFDVPRQLALATRWGKLKVQPLPLAEYRAQTAHVLEAVDRLKGAPGFTVVDPMEVIGQWRSLASEGRCFYHDAHHLSTWGAQQLRPLFRPIFERLVKEGVPQPAE